MRRIELLDIDSRTKRVVPLLLEDTLSCASVSADGGTLVVGSYENTLVVADTTRLADDDIGEETDLPSDYVIGAALSQDEEYVACWSIDHSVVVWHARSGHIRYLWNGRERNADAGDRLNDVQFSPDGNWLAITRGEHKKCRTLIVNLSHKQLTFDTKRALGYVDVSNHLCREQFVCRFSPDGGAAAILTHHELLIVNLSRSEIEFRAVTPQGLLNGDISMEWSDKNTLLPEQYTSFIDYCNKRWMLARRTVYQKLQVYKVYQQLVAAQTADNTSPGFTQLPTSESQIRALLTLRNPEMRVKAWAQAVAVGTEPPVGDQGSISAAMVEDAVDKIRRQHCIFPALLTASTTFSGIPWQLDIFQELKNPMRLELLFQPGRLLGDPIYRLGDTVHAK